LRSACVLAVPQVAGYRTPTARPPAGTHTPSTHLHTPVLLRAGHGFVKLQKRAQGMAASQLRAADQRPQPALKLSTPPVWGV
jgi:hypothetical protein